jgi:hypothetical protein
MPNFVSPFQYSFAATRAQEREFLTAAAHDPCCVIILPLFAPLCSQLLQCFSMPLNSLSTPESSLKELAPSALMRNHPAKIEHQKKQSPEFTERLQATAWA